MTRDRSSPREPQESPPNSGSPSPGTWIAATAIRVTMQLAGVAIAINEAVIREETRNAVLLIVAMFVMGAQRAEAIIQRAVDHLFGAGNGSGR
jgi:hypothetical protein